VQLLTVFFAATATSLWLSVFGYYGLLWLLARTASTRRSRRGEAKLARELPPIAIVVPTLNEQGYIQAKIADIQRTDYPAELVQIVVVDGNSTDQTAEIVRALQPTEQRLQLLSARKARRKQHQVIHALSMLKHDYLVFTDADSTLEPDCVRQLITLLQDEPETGIAAAHVVPETGLLEERVHWLLMNALWRLEGEVMSATGFSGVCYAVRRTAVEQLKHAALTEDIYLACVANARGNRVRMCPTALAHELRVPQRWQELIGFRHRRGAGYVYELLRALVGRPKAHWGLARGMRLLHLVVLPRAAVALATLGLVLAAVGRWKLPSAALAIYGFSTLGLVLLPSLRLVRDHGRIRVLVASIRYLVLAIASLLTLRWRQSKAQIPLGGTGHGTVGYSADIEGARGPGNQ